MMRVLKRSVPLVKTVCNGNVHGLYKHTHVAVMQMLEKPDLAGIPDNMEKPLYVGDVKKPK